MKELPAVDGFVHVRKNGAKKWRVYKVVGGKRLSCQCRNEGNAKRVLLEVAVATSTVTTVHELRALVQNCLPEIAARKPFQMLAMRCVPTQQWLATHSQLNRLLQKCRKAEQC